jgi:effector-binding domain-containing protein
LQEIVEMTLNPQPTIVMRGTLSVEEMGQWLPKAFWTVSEFVTGAGGHLAGPPFARYEPVEGSPGHFEVEAGFPVFVVIEGKEDVFASELPGGHTAHLWHIGPYENMEADYHALSEWIAARHGKPYGGPWEVYHSDPQKEPDPATWRTEIYMPYHLDFI